jgi:hypothetical protein
VDKRRFRFRAADCEAITDELGLVDWHVFALVRELTCAFTIFMFLYGFVLKNLGQEPQRIVPKNFRG